MSAFGTLSSSLHTHLSGNIVRGSSMVDTMNVLHGFKVLFMCINVCVCSSPAQELLCLCILVSDSSQQ